MSDPISKIQISIDYFREYIDGTIYQFLDIEDVNSNGFFDSQDDLVTLSKGWFGRVKRTKIENTAPVYTNLREELLLSILNEKTQALDPLLSQDQANSIASEYDFTVEIAQYPGLSFLNCLAACVAERTRPGQPSRVGLLQSAG